MPTKALSALLCLLFTSFFSFANTPTDDAAPIFKLCQEKLSDPDEVRNCSQEALSAFIDKSCRYISKKLGFYSNETVTATIKVKDDGSLRIRSLDSRYTTILEDEVREWIQLLDEKLLPAPGGNDLFTLQFQFEVPSQEEVDWRETDDLPTKPLCQNFNAIGQRSCLLDALQAVIGDLHFREMQAYSDMDVILTHSGQYIGVRFKSPVTRGMKKVNDSIALRFGRLRGGNLVNYGRYSNKNIRINYTYDHFMSAPHRRHFFQEMATEILKYGDTTTFLNNLVESASDFHQYKHFMKYMQDVITQSGIDKSKKFGYWAQPGQGTLDSLFNDHYYFDERTTRRLKRSYMPARHLMCPEDDSLGECSVSFIAEEVRDYLLKEYGVDLTDDRFSNPAGPATKYNIAHQVFGIDIGSIEGYIGIKLQIDEKGRLITIDPFVQSHDPMYDAYQEAKENGAGAEEVLAIINSNITFLVIDALSQISDLHPATWEERPCKSAPEMVLHMGKKE